MALFLLLGRDVYIPTLVNLLQPKLQYLGGKSSLLLIEMLREASMSTAVNLKKAKERQPLKKIKGLRKFKV